MSRPSIDALMRKHKLALAAEAEQEARENAFIARMSLAAATFQPRRAATPEFYVEPRPHPSDEGARPLGTNLPVAGQRIMPQSHFKRVKWSNGAAGPLRRQYFGKAR